MSINLHQLDTMDRPGLIDAWEASFGVPPPPSTSQDMMRLIIGWELQAKSARTNVRALKAAVTKLTSKRSERDDSPIPVTKPKTTLSAGTRLSRDWQGKTYSVDVLDKGYAYNGRLFTSLSPIAKAITGSHRSGPHFFGVFKCEERPLRRLYP